MKERLCEAIEQLDAQEAWKGLRVAMFPLEAMPEGRTSTRGGSSHRAPFYNRRRVHQLVGVGGGPRTTGGEQTATGKQGEKRHDTTRRLRR
jgi:hypothetical protein